MPLKILNWNVQNFGATRQTADRISQVCRVLNDANADIVCIQELVVSTRAAAAGIVANLNHGIVALGGNPYEYILCPHNGFEMYLYLYRGGAALQALALGPAGPARVDGATATQVTWTPYQGSTLAGNGPTGLDHYFPLFDYDGIGGAARPPGMGIFRYTGPGQPARDLCILNWHNDASGGEFIRQNLGRLARTPLIQAGAFNVVTPAGAVQVQDVVIAADFNDDLAPNPFTAYTRHIQEDTHLRVFDRTVGYADHLAVRDRCYDNLLTSLHHLAAGNAGVVDLPQRLMNEQTGATQHSLANSDLVAQANQQRDYRQRMISRITSNRSTKRMISKRSLTAFRTLIDGVNLGTVRTGTLRRRINGLQVPQRQRDLFTAAATAFIDTELTTVSYWARRLADMQHLTWGDTLFLTRAWMSDHLPVDVTLLP